MATFVTSRITDMNTRLKQFLAAENISQAQFADTIKVVRASVSHVLSGRNNPGYDFIKAIMTAYPSLNMEWLILGKGKMYREPLSDATTVASEPDFGPIYNEPNLFEDYNLPEETVHPDSNSAARPQTTAEPTQVQSTFLQQMHQPEIKQRKVVKVTVFFDDGTYQEM